VIDCTFIPSTSSSKPSTIRLTRDHYFFNHLVPVGFVSDGGTIPKLATLGIDRWGEALECFILHDYLLTLSALGRLTDKEADATLYNHCISIGINKIRAKAIYAGVRVGSWIRG